MEVNKRHKEGFWFSIVGAREDQHKDILIIEIDIEIRCKRLVLTLLRRFFDEPLDGRLDALCGVCPVHKQLHSAHLGGDGMSREIDDLIASRKGGFQKALQLLIRGREGRERRDRDWR